MNRKIIPVLVMIVLVALSCGCIRQDETPTEAGSLTTINIKDKPTEDFKYLNVTFSGLKLYDGDNEEWEEINLETTTMDLIQLHMENLSETLGLEEIETGNYSKLWIMVDNATGVLNETGETVYIKVPSETLKIQHLFDLREGNNTLTVEIDLDKSVHSVGQGKKYILVPVIGALRVEHANGTTARIRDQEKLKNMTGNRPPSIDLVANGTRGKPVMTTVNETITFNASETFDVEGDDITFTWDFGDNTSATTGEVVSHAYNETGSYTVTLTASDGDTSSTDTVKVVVKGGPGNKGNGGNGNP
ncbi:MAG: PKD domain-containing protein [Candidatus Thermoplasmatota archaeon]